VQELQDTESEIISAVKSFASSINSGGKAVVDMSSLVDATSLLALEKLGKIECKNAS